MALLFAGCTEIYIPEVDAVPEALVVDGLITDGAGPYYVTLNKASSYSSSTKPYGSDYTISWIWDAKISVTDSEGQTFDLTYLNRDRYVTPANFSAVTGRSYTLRVETSDGTVYESDLQQLKPAQTLDSIYTVYNTQPYLDDYGKLQFAGGYDVRANLFHNATEPAPLCRFESNVVVQYHYNFTEINTKTLLPEEWFWFVFGWGTFDLDETTNITEESSKTTSTEIKNHLLCFIPKELSRYGLNAQPYSEIMYYYRLSQYTINESTYQFYENANKQLSASGKLFDPVTSQLHGNMHCVSNPDKVVLGMFEVSSVVRSAYLVRGKVTKVPYIDIVPARDGARYKAWPDNRPTKDPEFTVIPYPVWWFHTN